MKTMEFRKPSRSLPIAVAALLASLLSAGCSTTLEARATPDADLSASQTFFVEKNEKDDHDIEVLLRDELIRWGRPLSAGHAAEMPPGTDVLVRDTDSWDWDLSMYRISLDVHFLDPATEETMATGRTMRTSLARKSPAYMVREVIEKMFSEADPAETPPSEEAREAAPRP